VKPNIIFLFFGMAIGLLLFSQTVVAQESTTVLKVAGKAEILKQGRWFRAKKGQELLVGQAIRMVNGGEVTLTSEGGNIIIVVLEGSTVKYKGLVAERSVPWLSSPKPAPANSAMVQEFEVVEGQANINVTDGQPLRVITPLVVAAVRGTDFTLQVESDGSSTVIVREGSVMATGRNGTSKLVNAGSSYTLTAAQYSDYLKKKKVPIPQEGWKHIPNQQLETLDATTFKSGIPGQASHKSRSRPSKSRPSNKVKNLS
jgi:hypothetical protein